MAGREIARDCPRLTESQPRCGRDRFVISGGDTPGIWRRYGRDTVEIRGPDCSARDVVPLPGLCTGAAPAEVLAAVGRNFVASDEPLGSTLHAAPHELVALSAGTLRHSIPRHSTPRAHGARLTCDGGARLKLARCAPRAHAEAQARLTMAVNSLGTLRHPDTTHAAEEAVFHFLTRGADGEAAAANDAVRAGERAWPPPPPSQRLHALLAVLAVSILLAVVAVMLRAA